MIDNLKPFEGFNISINITQQCNMRCKYCYETSKCNGVIELDTAKKFIDLILSERQELVDEELARSGLILDLIGGDALMYPELCDKILTYLQLQLNLRNDYYKNMWRVSISTNGTLFSNPKVRDFMNKWKKVLSVGISIDGCPEIHDKYRVMADGSPSMPKILEYWDWYKQWDPVGSSLTKSTCSRDSIPYLYDSLVYMHKTLGINHINQNFVSEDVGYTDEDMVELDKQLEKCVDYVLKHSDDIYWSMIDRKYTTSDLKNIPVTMDRGYCGSGSMPACSIDGNIYPCFRWLPISMTRDDSHKFICGNVNDGFNNKSAFNVVSEGSKLCNCCKNTICMDCELLPVCSYCIAGCYTELGEFRKTTHICEITKLQHKWADIYWERYYETHPDRR